ncbi:MAG: heat-inducible transcriptional repressor HrcA [Nitrospiraceae bacterium]|nr:heat-inducible transcriptional repressor HrcA [Nitrospiraceae bacterium]
MDSGMINERTERVLFAVVQSFISTNEPVGSRFITKAYSFNLSPATIRNIMADLEEFGFLSQPHTSAGRVPTDRGYRFYVDHIAMQKEAEDRFLKSFIARLEATMEDLDGLLEVAARTLSEHSRYLGLAAPMKSGKTTLNRIELFNYRGSYIAVMLLTDEGLIKHKLIRMDQELSARTLRRMSEYLNQEFSGYTIDEIRFKLIREMSREKALCDILISKAVQICREALTFPAGDIHISGFSDFIGLPDFSDRIRQIAGAIEDKHFMLKLLEQVGSESEDVPSVVIGSENPVKEMRDLSMVVSVFKQGGKTAGTVGVIGPTRMDYTKAIVMVQTTARFITEALLR